VGGSAVGCVFHSTYFPYFSVSLLIKLTLITGIIANNYKTGEAITWQKKKHPLFLSKESLTKTTS